MMLELRRLNEAGNDAFKNWLESDRDGAPPSALLNDETYSESYLSVEINPYIEFESQYQFGQYINGVLEEEDFNAILSPDNDGFWNWLSIVYFKQLAPKQRKKFWCYLVMRKGAVGSLAYRQVLRTAYELYNIHSEDSKICLSAGLPIWTDIEEALTSRQTIAHNKGFFRTATDLYIQEGKVRRGAASKPKKKKLRKPGDKTGYGSVRRLAIALQRLDLTYDTESMDSKEISLVLPREFGKWKTI